MRKRRKEATEEGLHCLDDEVEVAFELETVGGEERLEELAELRVDGTGASLTEVGPISGTDNRNAP